ncbi:MAG: cupin domain-containing protein [Cyclobacteriaceae bacterium]
MGPFRDFKSNESKQLFPGFNGRFEHGKDLTFSFWEIAEGSDLPEHSHPQEQVSIIIKGELELTIDGEAKVVKPGMMAMIPSNAVHSGKALTACEVIDVFTPVREDYKFD